MAPRLGLAPAVAWQAPEDRRERAHPRFSTGYDLADYRAGDKGNTSKKRDGGLDTGDPQIAGMTSQIYKPCINRHNAWFGVLDLCCNR
jgi:hypothetical protein